MKKGLVLEGGAMRGMFSAGVVDVFMEEGVEFDGCAGTSAGVIVGCNVKSKQIGRMLRYNVRFCKDPRYVGIRSLIFTGNLYNAKFDYRIIPYELDVFDTETFKNNPMEFYVCCTDVTTGKPVYHKCYEGTDRDLDWMRASASMPLVSKIVKVDGFKLLDGGMSDSIPLKFMEKMGYGKNVVILTRPFGYVKHASKAVKVFDLLFAKYPNLAKAIKERPEKYNKCLEYIHSGKESGEVFVIQPDADLGIGKVERDPENLKRVYELGRKKGRELLPKVVEFMA